MRHFISGGAVGVDTWAMEAVLALRKSHRHITLECAVPFAGMAEKFDPPDRLRFRRLCREIDILTILSDRRFPGCMQRRNEYMVDRSAYLIAVWTGARSGTANTIRYAKQRGRHIHQLPIEA